MSREAVAAELHAAETGALLEVRADLGTLRISGKDRVSWLNGVVTQELASKRPGDAALALCVQRTGKLLTEVWLVFEADCVWLAAPRHGIEALAQHLDRHLVMEDVELEDASATRAWLALHGPRGAEVAQAALSATEAAHGTVDLTGLGGAVTCARSDELEAVVGALTRAGAVASTANGLAQLFVERGAGQFGVDYGESHYPQEASVERRAVSFQKGCYLGQEAVFMLEARGRAKQRLRAITISGEGEVQPGALLFDEASAEAGKVTRCAPFARDGERPALAFVKHKHLEGESPLRVEGRASKLA
jgi:folate-binding protein YgfZ